MSLPEFKNKRYNELSRDEKITLIERVCMDTFTYLNYIGRGGKDAAFVGYWKDKILTHKNISNSAYLNPYIFTEENFLCVMDKQGVVSSLKYSIFEILLFVHNAVVMIPVRSNLIDRILAGDSIEEIEDTGILKLDILKNPSMTKKKGRPGNPDSLAQRIKRGEITRYEAYQKKTIGDDAL